MTTSWAVAGLTAVDGATIITDRYELLAFGAKITRRKGSPSSSSVTVTEPIEGTERSIVHPTRLGGTRHLSAAQFVQDQRDALALVASQDGRFTIFAWSPCEEHGARAPRGDAAAVDSSPVLCRACCRVSSWHRPAIAS